MRCVAVEQATLDTDERALRYALKMCGLKMTDLPALERFHRSGGITAIQRFGAPPPPLTLAELRRDSQRRAKAEEWRRKLERAEERRIQELRAKNEALERRTRRAEAFTDLYMNGMTLQQIGSLYGLTGQRVRQVIVAHADNSGRDIGKARKGCDLPRS